MIVGMRVRMGFFQSSTGLSSSPTFGMRFRQSSLQGTLLLSVTGDHKEKLREVKENAELD